MEVNLSGNGELEDIQMEKKLVSIISPCYNGEAFVARFLENILEQTYPRIEFIFVNDGSSDKTEEIVKSYSEKFEKKGYELIYIYQDNAGQAAAVNKGLKIFNGEYFMWMDSDDLMDAENIEKKVAFLEEHAEIDFVMCRGRMLLENESGKKIGELKRVQPQGEDNLFLDLLIEKNVVYTPGVYLVRKEAFLKVNPKREIIESRVGQNWQMLLPLAYSCKYGYIKEELFSYIVRDDSHSRQEKTLEQVLEKLKNHNDLLFKILKEMNLDNSEYKKILVTKYIRKQFDAAYFHHNKKLLTKKYQELKENGGVSMRDTLIYWSGKYKLVDMAYQLFKKVKELRRSKQ